MRGSFCKGAWLLAAWMALLPTTVRAQGYAPPDWVVPLPYGSTRPENGGFFIEGGYLMLRGNNPLKRQVVARRGFQASDGTIARTAPGPLTVTQQQFINPANILQNGQFYILDAAGNFITLDTDGDGGTDLILIGTPIQINVGANFYAPGEFVGSGVVALTTDQLTGNDTYRPGFEIAMGWKFDDNAAVTFRWRYLTEAQYRAGASLVPRNGILGPAQEETYLFAPVFNFPAEFSGPDFPVRPVGAPLPSAQSVFGIWNGASIMTIDMVQRFQQFDITLRETLYETDDIRISSVVGPRYAWFWDRFRWRTTKYGLQADGNISAGPDDVGLYTNITSNRMYGVFMGCEQECYLGYGFTGMLRTEVAGFLNSVKERAKYETANRYAGRPESKLGRREWSFVPEVYAQAGLMWYPTEFVQLFLGYEFSAFFNTLASRKPIDFDYANLNPKWSSFHRYFDGFTVNLALQF